MSAHLTEEEQIEALKRWWKDNGTATLAAVAITAGGWFAWGQYTNHLQNKADAGSVLYKEFAEIQEKVQFGDASEEDQKTAEHLATQLIQEHDGSLYEDFARLHMAKMAVAEENFDEAKTQLLSVIDSAADETLPYVAKLRLARVYFAEKDYDKALDMLDASVPDSFAASFAELRGDILMAKKDFAEAKTAYETAMSSEVANPMRQSLIQLKIDNTKVASKTPDIPDPELRPNPHAAPQDEAAGDA